MEFATPDVNVLTARLCVRQGSTFVSTSAFAQIFVIYRHMARPIVILFYDMGASDS